MNALLLSLALTPAAQPDDWKAAEDVHLKNIKPVTADFVRAGFDHDDGFFRTSHNQVQN